MGVAGFAFHRTEELRREEMLKASSRASRSLLGLPPSNRAAGDCVPEPSRDERTALLLDVSRDVSSQGDLRERLDRVHRHIAAALDADFVGTAREDRSSLESRIVHHLGVPQEIAADLERVRVPRGAIFGGRVSAGETMVLSAAETRTLLPYDLGERLALSTLVVVPLVVRGRFYGALLAGTGGIKVLPSEGVEILEAIATQIASAIEAADVEDRRREEGEVSRSVARIGTEILGSLDSPDLLDRLCQVGGREVGSDLSCVFLAEKEGEQFQLAAAAGLEESAFDALREIPIPRTAVLELTKLLEKKSVVPLPAERFDRLVPAELRRAYGVRQCLAIAIRRGTELVGVNTVSWRGVGAELGEREHKIGEALSTIGSMALERTRARMAAAEASQLKSDFVATISHELRTPLNVILGYAEMLLDGALGELNEEQADVVGRLDGSARGLFSLINATLDLSRLEAGRVPVVRSDFGLSSLVREVTAQCTEAFAKPGVGCRIHLSGAVDEMPFDREKLRLILSNLVGNAFKFTSDGEVEVSVSAENEVLRCRVKDSGRGIREEDQNLIFESFRQAPGTAEANPGGVGLGLYIVRQIVAVLDGEISVESELGEGACFEVLLPAATPTQPHG